MNRRSLLFSLPFVGSFFAAKKVEASQPKSLTDNPDNLPVAKFLDVQGHYRRLDVMPLIPLLKLKTDFSYKQYEQYKVLTCRIWVNREDSTKPQYTPTSSSYWGEHELTVVLPDELKPSYRHRTFNITNTDKSFCLTPACAFVPTEEELNLAIKQLDANNA